MGNSKRTSAQKIANHKRASALEMIDPPTADPPAYTSQAPSEQASSSNVDTEQSTLVPTSALKNLDFTPSLLELPTAAECITHLKLLHAFAKLRYEVGRQDGLFGIHDVEKFEDAREELSADDALPKNDGHQPDGVHGTTINPSAEGPAEQEKAHVVLAELIREKRWIVFVTKAVDRFEKWWHTLPSTSSHFPAAIRTIDFDTTSHALNPNKFPTHGDGLKDKIKSLLPPIDVLMVWHAHMLNPRAYLEDCMRLSQHKIWQTEFPWELIHNAIDNETFEYTPSHYATRVFERSTRTQWYATFDTNLKTLSCPSCKAQITVPWTRPPAISTPEAIEAYLARDTGFAGKAFEEMCTKCHLVITHEKLRVAKFIKDAEDLLNHKRPLPGTVLNSLGVPQMTEKNKHIGTHDPFFPNRVVENLVNFQPSTLRREIKGITVALLRNRFESTMGTEWKVKEVNSAQYKKEFVAKESKIAVRKMLSHYWDNSSPFGLDLVGAVIRQGSFVQKMCKIDWLHSPAAVATMQRLIVKYHRFVRIIADNPKRIAVPTLDVDLAWHTHQLTPKVYFRYTLSETKKFLNHDDKIPETSLHTYFQWTANAYEKKYGQPYSECACWYCECTREPLRSSFTNRVNPLRSSKQYDVEQLVEKGYSKDPMVGVHISSHNAVMMDKSSPVFGVTQSWAQQRRREFEELDLQYAKVCKRYQKKKKADETPSKDNEALMYSAYGYPMFYPVYVPYYAEPSCEGDRYTNSSGGSCAAGTCAGSASLGSCAGGAGTPGCKASCGGHGDASGGCGTCGGGDGGGCGGGCGG